MTSTIKRILQNRFLTGFIQGGVIGIGISLFFFLIFSGYQGGNLLLTLLVNMAFGFLVGGFISLFNNFAICIIHKFLHRNSWTFFIVPVIAFIVGFGVFYLLVSFFNIFITVMPPEIEPGVSLGVGVISTMITFFYMFLEQQQEKIKLERENRRLAVVEERNRIARELHDSVSQNLFGISLNLTTLPGILETDQDKAFSIITQLQAMVQEIQTEMRLMIYELGPVGLQKKGFFEAMENLVSLFRKRYNKDISYSFAGEEEKLDSKIQLVLYRVLQESLNNAIKHSGVDKIKVSLNIDKNSVEMSISDKGKGFKIEEIDQELHFGISGMRERVEGVGGHLFIKSDYGKGTIIQAVIPY